MKNKALFFKNLFVSSDGKEDNDWFHQATLYLASSFTQNKIPFLLCNSKFSLDSSKIFDNNHELDEILKNHPEINMVFITLLEGCFFQTKKLVRYIRSRSDALIAVGGMMPTLTPEHVMAHLPEANLIIRGEGEEILPQIYKTFTGIDYRSTLSEKTEKSIRKSRGIIYHGKDHLIYSDDQEVNYVENLDNSKIDFSLLDEENIKEGLNLSSSRGCRNACFFCSMPQKGRFRSKTFNNLKSIIASYERRLTEIYGEKKLIPDFAYRLSFNDDDFLGDRERAIKFFNFIKTTKFKINYFQAAINSFFIYKNGQSTDELDHELLKAIQPEIFYNDDVPEHRSYSIYIGTENFCNEELGRLGKGYGYDKIVKVVSELSKKRIMQAHHLILTNRQTKLGNIIENFIKISVFKAKYGDYFDILRPVITNLVSLYPSISYKTYRNIDKNCHLKLTAILHSDKFPDLDYPLVEKDLPEDADVKNISQNASGYLTGENYFENFIEQTMLYLIKEYEKLRISKQDKERAEKIKSVLDIYHNYPELIKKQLDKNEKSRILKADKSNMQIILTRRCPLRCSYCPIPKKEIDMSYRVCRKAIDLLMRSNSENIRLDFTGGEPLLRFNILKKAINYAQKKAEEKSKNISFYIVTNGLLLTKEVVEFLDNKDVLLEISLDGDEKVHNKFKIPVDKRLNPHQKTVANLANLSNRNIRYFAVIVATPATVKNLAESFSYVINLGINRIEINYAIGSFWDKDNQNVFKSEMKKIVSKYYNQIMDKEIELGNLEKRSEPAALNSEIMIDTDGSIKLLSEFLFKSKKIKRSPYDLGKISKHENFDSLYFNKFMSYYILQTVYAENNEKIRKILENNIAFGNEVANFIKSEFGELIAAAKGIKSLNALGLWIMGNNIDLPPLESQNSELVTIYRRIANIWSNKNSSVGKKMKVADHFLMSLIFAHEEMVLKKYLSGKTVEYSDLIEKYSDYPKRISKSFNLSLEELSEGVNRLVVLVTHSCQLNCAYCSVRKYDAEMDFSTLKKSIDLLFTSKKTEVQLQFFGGEPLIKFELIKQGVEYAKFLSKKKEKAVRFILTTNGILLSKEKTDYLVKNNFTIECSLDGDAHTQLRSRKMVSEKNYYHIVLENLKYLSKQKTDHYIIMVVQPNNVKKMYSNVNYLIKQGFDNIQINYALGKYWNERNSNILFEQIKKVKKLFIKTDNRNSFINLSKTRREPVVLNSEITVDCNGDIFLETGICLENDFSKLKRDFWLGNLKNTSNINEFFATPSRNFKRLVDVYAKDKHGFRKIILNNIEIGLKFNHLMKDRT